MDESRTNCKTRIGPIRPPRPSMSFEFQSSSPRGSPRCSSDNSARIPLPKPNHDVRSTSQLRNQLSPGPSASFRHSGAGSTTASESKKSFKKAVRKLFGRKSKEEPPEQAPSPKPPGSGHQYHRSDPGHFYKPRMSQTPQPLSYNPPDTLNPRTFSVPLPFAGPLDSPRMRSPNAINFPKSSQLKPLDLASPFHQNDNHNPKRRATLPTINTATSEAPEIGTALGSPPDSGMAGISRDLPESEIGLAVTSSSIYEKRRSRSTDDLKKPSFPRPARNRSQEIRFWRESFAGSVLLHPYTLPEGQTEHHQAHKDRDMPRADFLDPEVTATIPQSERRSAYSDSVRPATAGADRTEDLERRVAKIELDLREFQRSLERMTLRSRADTLSPIQDAQQIRRQHTPSILVDTLQNPSWHPEALELYEEDLHYEDAGEVVEREWGGKNHGPPFEESRPKTSGKGTVRQDTYTALYGMINDERQARQRLESEFRHLQHEVSTMASRLERGSWNSYSVVGQFPMHHRPRTPEESIRGASSHSAYINSMSNNTNSNQRVVSRFSGSDSVPGSEIYGLNNSRQEHRPADDYTMEEQQDIYAPYDIYRTPMEERNSYTHGRHDGMF